MENIRFAKLQDISALIKINNHIDEKTLTKLINNRKVIVFEKENIVGFLTYSYFWHTIPFLDLIYFEESERNKGYGKKLLLFWESYVKEKGYNMVLTSTQSNENGQHFYRKLGYTDCGSLILPKEVLEIFLYKKLD